MTQTFSEPPSEELVGKEVWENLREVRAWQSQSSPVRASVTMQHEVTGERYVFNFTEEQSYLWSLPTLQQKAERFQQQLEMRWQQHQMVLEGTCPQCYAENVVFMCGSECSECYAHMAGLSVWRVRWTWLVGWLRGRWWVLQSRWKRRFTPPGDTDDMNDIPF